MVIVVAEVGELQDADYIYCWKYMLNTKSLNILDNPLREATAEELRIECEGSVAWQKEKQN